MENNSGKYFYEFGLLSIIGGVALAMFGVLGKQLISIVGFLIFLIAVLRLLDKAVLFKELQRELWILIGYTASITVLIYIAYPYNENKAAIEPLWNKWYIEMLTAAGYAPALILAGLRELFDVPIQYILTLTRTHYPFAFGFWVLYLLMKVTLRLYPKIARKNPNPMIHLLVAYNFIIGAVTAIWLREMGIFLALTSVLVWTYIYCPRFGIPTVFSTRLRKREIRRAGREIQKAQDRLENILSKIEKI